MDGWFLPDGTTSESPAYGTMTLGGIWDLAQAFRGYSDPPGYRDAAGKRIDSLDLYHGTAYERVWECFFRGLQGDLHYPPYADSSRGSSLGVNFIELMVSNYPDRPQYLALLKETLGAGRATAGDRCRGRGAAGTAEGVARLGPGGLHPRAGPGAAERAAAVVFRTGVRRNCGSATCARVRTAARAC